jgi:hypothetical protein
MLVCAVAGPAFAFGAAPVPVTVGSAAVGPPVAAGFVGLATEYWDIEKEVGSNPAQRDAPFEQVVRNLAPGGGVSFRIGGDSTDWTWWPIPGRKQPPWVRWTMTPAWASVTRRLVEDLHAHLIVGINMEAGSLPVAGAEFHELDSSIGRSVPTTFELGNEPELYSHFPFYHDPAGAAVYGRPKNFSLAQMTAQWNQLASVLPNVRLAGPGFAGLRALSDVTQFLSRSHRLSLLTVHTYPLKATRCTGSTHLAESQLFEPQSLTQIAAGVGSWTSLARRFGVGLRVDEMNSVTCGGQRGFSNTFGPALWALNILPLYAADGANGVNFQTKPYSAQNLIQTLRTRSGWQVQVQPEYYGLLAFARLTPPGSRMLQVSSMPAGMYAWAVRTPQGRTHVVVTNVGGAASTVTIRATGASGPATVEALSAASGGLQASSGVTLGGQSISASTGQLSGKLVTTTVQPTYGGYELSVPAASAEIVTFKA